MTTTPKIRISILDKRMKKEAKVYSETRNKGTLVRKLIALERAGIHNFMDTEILQGITDDDIMEFIMEGRARELFRFVDDNYDNCKWGAYNPNGAGRTTPLLIGYLTSSFRWEDFIFRVTRRVGPATDPARAFGNILSANMHLNEERTFLTSDLSLKQITSMWFQAWNQYIKRDLAALDIDAAIPQLEGIIG